MNAANGIACFRRQNPSVYTLDGFRQIIVLAVFQSVTGGIKILLPQRNPGSHCLTHGANSLVFSAIGRKFHFFRISRHLLSPGDLLIFSRLHREHQSQQQCQNHKNPTFFHTFTSKQQKGVANFLCHPHIFT